MKKTTRSIASFCISSLLLLFVSCSNSDNSEPEEEGNSEITSAIAGSYAGVVRADVGEMLVSIIVRPSGAGVFSGEYYGTGNFTPCCNSVGREDGTFNFMLNGDDIVNMQIFTNLEMQQCMATYMGSGVVTVMNDRNVLELVLIENGCFFENLETTWTVTKVMNLEE